MIVQLSNHQTHRIRKDLLRNWVNGLLQLNYEETHGQLLHAGIDHDPFFYCPRCGTAANQPESELFDGPAFVRLNGSPIEFKALMDENSDGLQRREIHQCMGCQLVIAESYFCPGPVEFDRSGQLLRV